MAKDKSSSAAPAHGASPDEIAHMAAGGELHHPGDLTAEPHGADDHGETHGHDDHAHAEEEALGPVDVFRWGALAVGIGAGLAVALCLVIATRLLAPVGA